MICRKITVNDSNDLREVYRHDGEWKFGAIGQGTKTLRIAELATRYKKKFC